LTDDVGIVYNYSVLSPEMLNFCAEIMVLVLSVVIMYINLR